MIVCVCVCVCVCARALGIVTDRLLGPTYKGLTSTDVVIWKGITEHFHHTILIAHTKNIQKKKKS
jgi:hypothetical protein